MSEGGQRGWTRWWWLRVDQVGEWSRIELRAALYFFLTWTFAVIATGVPAWFFLNDYLRLGPQRSLVVWLIVAWPLNLPGLRGLASTLFPQAVISGDDAAAERLGGRVYLPTNEFWIRNFWWIDALPIAGSWTDNQMRVRERTLLIAFCVFVPTLLAVAGGMMSQGISERSSALFAFLLAAPVALYSARRVSIARWPELVRKADDDAVRLANGSVPPRV